MNDRSNNLDCEIISVNHEDNKGNGNLIQNALVVNAGRRNDFDSCIGKENTCNIKTCFGQFQNKKISTSFWSFPCIWAILTTLLFLLVLVIGAVTFVQISSEMDQLKEQFTVNFAKFF